MTYGPPSPYGPPPVFTPMPVIRPSVGWIVGAWVAAVILGTVAFIYGLVGVVSATADGYLGSAPTSTFTSGQSVTVTLDPANGPGVYADAYPQESECEVKGGTVNRVSAGTHVRVGEGTLWDRDFDLVVPAKGEYQVTCTASDYTGRFGIGDSAAAGVEAMSAKNTLYAVVMFGIPFVLLLGATAVNIVVAVKRGRYRRALGR